ncbi:protein phosphatase 2C domain-containing protein [Actinoplanes sp. NPDC023714]|uniref:PP2C family protein-serine/threonine phosphatase n=1 Tax=Actinoplanes sp. NPDC023714 TaxID=3154322 RepID=UPI0033F2EC96
MGTSSVEWTVAGRRLAAAAGTVVGERYDANYDVLHLDPDRPLAVVADGMGDGPGSRAAGRTAVDVFVSRAQFDPGSLRAAVAEVQTAVREAGRPLPGLTGCTLTAFAAGPDGAWLVQLGDSRAYRLRDGLLELLTVDHTVAWLGLLHGWFAAGSAEASVASRRLTRYAGHPDEPEPDLLNVALRSGDALLICTDGVSDQVGYDRLASLLATAAGPAAAVEAILEESLTPGDDNATAIVIRVS